MTTTKTLRLTFKNAKNKKVNLSLPDAAENLTEDEIKAAMNECVKLTHLERKKLINIRLLYLLNMLNVQLLLCLMIVKRIRTIFFEIKVCNLCYFFISEGLFDCIWQLAKL